MKLVSCGLGALAVLGFSLSALAAAIFESTTGNVSAGASASAAQPVQKGQRIEAGTVVTTGPKAMSVLRFDDGQTVVLNENTEFRLAEYRFTKEDPKRDSSVMELLRGAMRYVSGAIAQRNRQSVALRVPQATIGIRGTELMVALVNPAYMGVVAGAVGVTNTAGTVAFAAGQYASVATATTLATSIPAAALPASVAASFSQMAGVTVGAAAGAGVGAEAAGGAAAGGITPGVAAGIAVGAAAAAAAASSGGGSNPTSGATGTTGTR